jgi:tetratricopeptide (TPR) repeat protein
MRITWYFTLVVFSVIAMPATATENSKTDSLQALLTSTATSEKPIILNQLCELNRRDPRVFDWANECIRIARETNNQKEESIALKNLGIAFGFKNDYNTALSTLLEALTVAEKINDWSIAGDAAINIGTVYYVVLSNYDNALNYYLKALQFYEKGDNKKGIASALSGLGIAYTREKKFDQALETLNRSLSIYEELKEQRDIPKIHVNIADVYKEMNDHAKALAYLNKAKEEFTETKNSRGRAHALYKLAEIQRMEKQYDLAIANLTESMELNATTNHKNSIVDCLIELGHTYLDMKQPVKAEPQFLRVVALAGEINKKESISTAYQKLALISESKGDYENAYRYLSRHKLYYDSIFNAEKQKQIEEMQTRFETEKKEQEIVVLKQEKALNHIYLFIAAGVIISISVISLLIFNRQKLKIKAEREIAEKENQLSEERKTLLEAELKNKELSEQQLQNQLEFKNKELASYTLNLIQKNEILHNLKESVDEIRNTPDAQIKPKLNALASMVNYSFHLDREWENFKMHFEQVHQNFFKRLLEIYPDLSANDLKLCSLIKLNLDNRGIAAILNISQESAKVARHRLRKKLDLPADQTLIAFFNSLENHPMVVTV